MGESLGQVDNMNEAPELVVVRTFTNVPDAHVARSVLDAAGIPTHLGDDHLVAARSSNRSLAAAAGPR